METVSSATIPVSNAHNQEFARQVLYEDACSDNTSAEYDTPLQEDDRAGTIGEAKGDGESNFMTDASLLFHT